MDAAAAAVSVSMEPPIISEINIGGLALLTEALLEGHAVPNGDTVALALPTKLQDPPQDDNSAQIQEREEDFKENVVVGESGDDELRQPDGELVPPEESAPSSAAAVEEGPSRVNDVLVPTPVFVAQSGEHIHGAGAGGDIAAYFALEFLDMQYIYYLQRSSVSLGRSSTLNDPSTNGADIDLGPLKNISRLHARIEYEEEIGGFILAVIGRNGAFVDGAWQEPGRRVPLGDRTLIQISTRAFYFMLPSSSTPSMRAHQPHDLQSPEAHEVPALDSTVTTAEDDDSHSTSASATPKQRTKMPRRVSNVHDDDDDDDVLEEVDIELDDGGLYHSIGGKGKGKGKGKEAMVPPKRGRGRPRKNPHLPNVSKPKPRIRTPIDDDEDDLDMPMDVFDDSEDDERDDSGDDFVPKNTKRGTRGRGGLGKSRSGMATRTIFGTASRPRPSESVVDRVKDEEMSESLEPPGDEDLIEGDILMDETGEPLSPMMKRAAKRKRDPNDHLEDGPSDKRRKSVSGTKPVKPKGGKIAKKETKDGVLKGRKKGTNKPEMKSLFTTTPAPSLSSVIASKENALAEGGAPEGDTKGKGVKKKDKGKKKKDDDNPDGDEKDEDGEKDGEEVKKDLGPPPPKPPFTYPLLCYKALKALNGKAPYRAITKWLESEYPYFAFATKEGKDGWENSTRHTLSSHRAFIKIDRKPEERGKGCFWSFDPEFEEQFKDQWMAAESQSRNPRPRVGNPAGPSNPPTGPMAMYPRPPFGPGGWSGVTPPHLMPGYRPGAVPVPGQGPHPFPYPPMGRPPPGMPMPFAGPPGFNAPPGHPIHGGMHPPPLGGANGNAPKARAPKKPKQALGAAFSRAPLIRPGLGGVPIKSEGTSTANGTGAPNNAKSPGKVDELVMRGDHITRLAARVAKDELAGRAHPGAAMSVIMGGWGPPPHVGAKGKSPMKVSRPPPVGTKVPVMFTAPPTEALPVMPPPPVKIPLPEPPKSSTNPTNTNDPTSSSTTEETSSPVQGPLPPIPIPMPIAFYDGKLYINPKAYPLMKESDVPGLEAMTLAEILGFLGTRTGIVPMGMAKGPTANALGTDKAEEPKAADAQEAEVPGSSPEVNGKDAE